MKKLLLLLTCCLLIVGVCCGFAEDTAACEHAQTSIVHDVGGVVYNVCDACGAMEEVGYCRQYDCDIDGYCDVCNNNVGLPFFYEYAYGSVEKAAEATRTMLRARESEWVYFEVTQEEYEDTSLDSVMKFQYRVFMHSGEPFEGDYLDTSFVFYAWNSSHQEHGGRYFLGYKLGQMVYGSTAEQETAVNTKIAEIINANGWAALSGYDQIKAVYDWVCTNVAYDYDHLEVCDSFYHTADMSVPLQESYLPHMAYNGLFEGKCVCSGYTQLLYAFYNKLGVDCRIISGSAGAEGEPHAWNIVCLDDLYYFVDATWDAQNAQSGQEYAYFLRAKANMTDHYTDSVLLGAYEISDYDYGYTPGNADTVLESGTLGTVEWKLTGDGTLTFAGTGEIHQNPVTDKSLIRAIVIGDGITAIGSIDINLWSGGTAEAVFKSCANLESVTFGTGLTMIGDETFQWCESLTAVVIPDNVTEIGYAAFQRCENLESVSLPGNITVLHNSLFSVCSKLTDVVIPVSVTTIETYAFEGCEALTTLTLPAGLTSLGARVFYECASLQKIAIPGGVKMLDHELFFNCTSLTKVTLNEGLETLDSSVFRWCENLVDISLPSTVTAIGENCFNKTAITTINLPATMTEIPDRLFASCAELESIVIPSGVTHIGDDAFAHCSSLSSVTLPEGLISIGDYAFFACTALTNIDIPDGLTSIGTYAFSNCTALTGVTIPAGVTKLGDWVFYYCTSLTRVDGMESVTSIGTKAFYRCGQLKDFVMPSGVTSIGAEAFSDCSSLTSISIPQGVTVIGERVFSGCSGLTSVTLPSALTSIGTYAFYSCRALPEITIPAGVTDIGLGAFAVCYDTTIRCYKGSAADLYAQEAGLAVEYITAETITFDELPADLRIIEERAFMNCPLGNLRLPEGVTTIGSAAFKGAELEHILIPASVTSIAEDAFEGCVNLVIVGSEGSYAQEYAEAQEIYFIEQN